MEMLYEWPGTMWGCGGVVSVGYPSSQTMGVPGLSLIAVTFFIHSIIQSELIEVQSFLMILVFHSNSLATWERHALEFHSNTQPHLIYKNVIFYICIKLTFTVIYTIMIDVTYRVGLLYAI